MSKQAKQMLGQLFELNDNTPLSEGDILITRNEQSTSNPPTYDATMTIRGFPVGLNGKTWLLRLTQDIAGQVYLHIPSFILGNDNALTTKLTIFIITFIGSVWFGSDWFDSLG